MHHSWMRSSYLFGAQVCIQQFCSPSNKYFMTHNICVINKFRSLPDTNDCFHMCGSHHRSTKIHFEKSLHSPQQHLYRRRTRKPSLCLYFLDNWISNENQIFQLTFEIDNHNGVSVFSSIQDKNCVVYWWCGCFRNGCCSQLIAYWIVTVIASIRTIRSTWTI